ncbi:gp173 [Bacillus phage W.Ph.]|uniref:Gp173 n=1 Tax=Bacillus phage W.Ph. TaxID=764595 RepID=G9B1S4_9CAUD|nr:gp173 [Bacillus phage W.Ph.]ADH03319.2 gp173 [Bacillus phage W.Ph.]
MTLLTNNRKPLHDLNNVVHELIHYGYIDVNSYSNVTSIQVRDILDILGIKYEVTSGLIHDMYPYTRIKLV